MAEDSWALGMTQQEINALWSMFEPKSNLEGNTIPNVKITRRGRKRGNINSHNVFKSTKGCCVEGCRTSQIQVRNTIDLGGLTVAMCDLHVQELQSGFFASTPVDYESFTAKIRQLDETRTHQSQHHEASVQDQAAPYIKAGLAEEFALALVQSQHPEEILNLWEATWWKQYEPNDALVTSVLNETLSEEQARNINAFRGEHPELAMACIHQQVTVEWAQMLLESGFEEHPDAVKNVLEGADPVLIARIRGMDVKNAPPSTGLRILHGD